MNIKDQLLVEISKANTNYIATSIINNPNLVKDLMSLVFASEHPLPMRASWVATVISDSHPEILKPYIGKMIAGLRKLEHSGTRRNLLRYLATVEIPKKLEGKLFDDCYYWLISKDEPPGVKVHCMQIIYNIAQNEPDLLREFTLVLDELTNHESAGIRSRCNGLLKLINKGSL